jgi:hypothetical protein
VVVRMRGFNKRGHAVKLSRRYSACK